MNNIRKRRRIERSRIVLGYFKNIINFEMNDEDDELNYINLVREPYYLSTHHADVLAILNGDNLKCRRHIRVSYNSFICFVKGLEVKKQGWSLEFEVLTFLFWLAAGTSYRIVALALGIPKSTIFDITNKLLEYTTKVTTKFIKLPNIDSLSEIGKGFQKLGKSVIFQNAVGAIDGCYVRTTCAPDLHDQFVTRKLSYAIQLQAICDNNGKFIDIFTGYPGSVHDQRVLINSPIYTTAAYPPHGYYLLGDAGYALTLNPIAIITPFKNKPSSHLTPAEIKFNKHHALARGIIERCFGMMKTRWRYIFTRDSELVIKKTVKVIVACCILHNICIEGSDIFSPDVQEEPTRQQYEIHVPVVGEAVAFRQQLCDSLTITHF